LTADARDVLGSALEGFSPTPEFPEIEEARALLAVVETGAQLNRRCGEDTPGRSMMHRERRPSYSAMRFHPVAMR
jgi:hypothetical protein